MSDKTMRAKAKHLSLVLTAIATAPEGTDTSALSEHLSNHKISKAEQTALLKRGCTDPGAITACLTPGAPAKKKAAKKKAATKKAATKK